MPVPQWQFSTPTTTNRPTLKLLNWCALPEIAEKQADFSNKKNLEVVQKAMQRVNRYGGSGFTAFRTADYSSAGKTGTVQVSSQDKDYDDEEILRRLRD